MHVTEQRGDVNGAIEKCEDWWNELETTIQMWRGKEASFFFLIFVLSVTDIYTLAYGILFICFQVPFLEIFMLVFKTQVSFCSLIDIAQRLTGVS